MKGDKGLMIVSGAIIIVGIAGLFFNTTVGIITALVGIGMFIMGYVSKTSWEEKWLTKWNNKTNFEYGNWRKEKTSSQKTIILYWNCRGYSPF